MNRYCNKSKNTHPFDDPLSGTIRVSQYQKGKTNLDFTEARHSEWQWHQLGHMQVCTSLQTDNHASTPSLSFLQAGCPSCRPTNSAKVLKSGSDQVIWLWYDNKLLHCSQNNVQMTNLNDKLVWQAAITTFVISTLTRRPKKCSYNSVVKVTSVCSNQRVHILATLKFTDISPTLWHAYPRTEHFHFC